MPLYDYRAIDDYGKSHDGQLKAEDEKDLEKKLAEKGYYLLEAKEVRAIVKVSKPVKKAVPIKEDVPPGFRNTVTKGAKEIHLHQHIHQAPEPLKPSRLDLIGRNLQIAGMIITLLVSGLFFFSIFSLIIYLFYPTKSKPSPYTTQTKVAGSLEKSAIVSSMSSTQKEYISRAGGYLDTLNKYDRQVAEAMAGLNSGETTLNDVKKAIKETQYIEDASWHGDYQNYGKLIVPSSCFSLDAKIKKCRQLHDSALREMLDFWKDGNNAHIESGIKTFELAIRLANECVADLSTLMQSLR